MSRKASANRPLPLVALQQAVGAMFDHAPRRQAGQFVVIGRAEQMVLEGLLLGDVGRTRKQQIAVGDPDRPVRGEKHLLGLAAGDGILPARPRGRCAAIRGRFRGGRSVAARSAPAAAAAIRSCAAAASFTSRKLAVLVLNRHAGREHPEDIPQDAQFGFDSGFIVGLRRGGLKVVLWCGFAWPPSLAKSRCSFG